MGCGGSRHGALETALTTPGTAAGAPGNAAKVQKNPVGLADQVQATLPTVTLDGSMLPESVRAAALRDLSKRSGQHQQQSSPLSEDSGYTDDAEEDHFQLLDEEYGHVITESSPPELIKQVEEDFASRSRLLFVVELVVEGHGVPRLMSPKEKERVEQDEILETLRREGLVPKPPAKVNNGIKFEIVSSTAPFQAFTAPPNRPVTARRAITLQEIQEKLEKAEERRKQEEEKKRSGGSKGASPQANRVQQMQADMKARVRDQNKSKMDAKAKNRESHLKDLQRKLKAHQDHGDRVRYRKKTVAPSLSQDD